VRSSIHCENLIKPSRDYPLVEYLSPRSRLFAGFETSSSHVLVTGRRFGRRVREADGSIKPGAQAPGKTQKKGVEPAERAAALSPAPRARFLFINANLGLTPQALFCRPLRGLGVRFNES
jgi:hypothetical protein